MSETVITIVAAHEGGLSEALQEQALAAVKSAGVDRVNMTILAPGKAVDVSIGHNNPELSALLAEKLQMPGKADVFIQPGGAARKKRLLIADMDATMIEGETLDELAGHLGLKDEIAAITAQAMRGELEFEAALNKRVGLLKGLPVTALQETLQKTRFSKGGAALVKTMRRFGAKCVLVSGGFDFFTGHVADTLGFHMHVGNRLEIAEGKLTGRVIPPIVDKDTKKKTLLAEAKALNLPLEAVMAVGDGANDIPMLETAGTGVGYFGKPAVQAATLYQIRCTDLSSLLYMQGYGKQEFAA
ncbi:MAG: phosphoserine phosphatase SerB [Alphaproteobacteria bacterium]|nr:phosphoserine phosphatase SerB [Alphaproteobacteria bacterium]